MAKHKIGMWLYSNSGGDKIQKKIIKKLKKRDIKTVTDLNLRQAIVADKNIICNGQVMEDLDLFFSYNAGEQTKYQVYIYQALDKVIPIINNYDSFTMSEDKFQTSYVLNQYGVKTADYRLCHRDDPHILEETFKNWNKQMVYKPTDGWGGVGLAKIEDDSAFDMLKSFANHGRDRHIFVEKFIKYDNTDYRVDIVDGRFIACYGRKAPKNDWKTNITSGGSIMLREDINENSEVVKIAQKAVKAIGLEIAGVDLIYDKQSKEFVVLEVNGIPAFVTPEQEKMGLNFNDKKIDAIIDLIERKIKN